MKRKSDRGLSAIGRLVEWCESPSPPFSLVVGATCGCDLSRIEESVCRCVNEAALHPFEEFECFDCEDIRHLAGDPAARELIIGWAGMNGPEFVRWNDYSLVLRALAAMGGVVLCGHGALEAARDLPNVCEIMISRCEHCEDPSISWWVDPELCEDQPLERTVAGYFLQWLSRPDRVHAAKRRAMGIPEKLVAV